jgi:hypothetical protein
MQIQYSAAELTVDQISNHLYLDIFAQFNTIDEEQQIIQDQARRLRILFSALKEEFNSLATYENKLVFPTILHVVRSNKSTPKVQAANLHELQLLTQNKEKHIAEIADEIKIELSKASFQNPAMQKLLSIFLGSFKTEKGKWHTLLYFLQH